jgi:hypothetical protein
MKTAALALLVALLAVGSGSAQSRWTARTPDGQPDLQGLWVNFDSTPFERAGAVALRPGEPGVNPPNHWAENDSPKSKQRTAMVVDPPDGVVPVMEWAEAKRDYDLDHLGDAPEHETPWVRCITRGMPAGMFPAGYNNAYQIIQVPGYVVIVSEMIHGTRVIPIDGRAHVGERVRLWDGDSRGRWEGNTLVVETTNFNNKGSIGTSAATGRMRGIPSSDSLKIVEHFTRVDQKTIAYDVTIDDPKVYTRPWKVAFPLNLDGSYKMYEYACHEGNFSIPNELSAGRANEK